MASEIVGPFSGHRLVVDGWSVPLVGARPIEGGVELVLDERYSLTVSDEDFQQVAWFVAQCISVALGFACHPSSPESEPLRLPQLRPRRVACISAGPELVSEKGGGDDGE